MVDSKYGGEFKQKIALVADRDYTIPSIEFKYFDKNLKKVVTKKTQPIEIKVKGGSKKETKEPKIVANFNTNSNTTTPPNTTKECKSSSLNGVLMGIVGFVVGVFSIIVLQRFLKTKSSTKSETPLIKRVKRAKDDKELFRVLLPFAKKDEYLK